MADLAEVIHTQINDLLAASDYTGLDNPEPAPRTVLPDIRDTFEHQRYMAENSKWQQHRDQSYLLMFDVPPPRPASTPEITAENEAERKRLASLAQRMASPFSGLLGGPPE